MRHHYRVLTLLLSINCIYCAPEKPATKPQAKKSLTSFERRQIKEIAHLEDTYREVITDYAPILNTYKKLKTAPPAEYAYHLTQLKTAAVRAAEENKIGMYKSAVKRNVTKYLFGPPAENPLVRFRVNILPETIKGLSYPKRYVKESPLTKKVDVLVSELKEINRILT